MDTLWRLLRFKSKKPVSVHFTITLIHQPPRIDGSKLTDLPLEQRLKAVSDIEKALQKAMPAEWTGIWDAKHGARVARRVS